MADPSSSSSEGGIAAVAARIHERAVQLANEQEALQQAEHELKELQTHFAVETKRGREVHQRYLKSVLELHSVELECSTVEDQISERDSKTEQLKQQTSEIMDQLEQQKAEWESTVQDKLVQHKVRQELYQKHLQGAIEARNQAIARRKRILEKVARMTTQLENDRENTLQEQQRVQADMMRMTENEAETNKEVDSLASQVREALRKVSLDTSSILAYLGPPVPLIFHTIPMHFQLANSEPNCELLYEKPSRPTKMHTMKRRIWRSSTGT